MSWLGGGSYHDICISAGISISSLYLCVHKCIDVVLACDQLAYSFPTGDHEVQKAANDFKQCSTYGVIDGCVACLDGLLIRIQTPLSQETSNVKSYFSLHYQAYGLNIQAVCGTRCCFVYAAIAAPGGTNVTEINEL